MALPGDRRLLLLPLVVALAACGGGPPMRPLQLKSGRVVRVISVSHMQFSETSPALVLSYQTDLKIDQTEKLRQEVTDIWREFQADVDQAKLTSAIIMANEVPSGRFVSTNKSYNFVFERNADGTWPQEPSFRK